MLFGVGRFDVEYPPQSEARPLDTGSLSRGLFAQSSRLSLLPTGLTAIATVL